MRCFKLTDDVWGRLEAVLKSDKSTWRGKSESKWLFIEGVLSLLKDKKEFSTSLNWKNLNPKYGNSLSQCRTFNRWRDNGIWEKLLPVFASRANYAWVAKLGTYEVLLKNCKCLSKINKLQDELRELYEQ